MKPAVQYQIERIRDLAAPPTGDARRAMMDERLSPLAATMTTPTDPMLAAIDRYMQGFNPNARNQGWFGMDTVPNAIGRQNEVAQQYGDFAPETMMAYMESPIAPGFGVMSTVGKGAGALGDVARMADNLPMDEASRMARAQEMGFDVNSPIYHGTRADNITEFKDDFIGSAHDTGHYGKGHYFASTPGEAEYYGRNVGEYLTNARLLDLSNNSGDYTFLGHFRDFAPKLDAIGALDETNRTALKAYNAADEYISSNVEFLRAQSRDGSEGWMARVPNPAEGYADFIQARPSWGGVFPTTKEDALRALRDHFYSEMERFHPEVFPGIGSETASLSDYVRADWAGGSEGLTQAAKDAGYGGILYGDETVVFDPANIRSTRAKFDPRNIKSRDLLASGAGGAVALGLAGGNDAEAGQ